MYSSLSCFLETYLHRYSKSMISGEYKTVLNELFDVLQLSEESRERAIIIFKHKLAGTLLQDIQGKFNPEERTWLDMHQKDTEAPDMNDPMVVEIQKRIAEFPKEELLAQTRPLFKKMLTEYVDFMAARIDSGTAEQLRSIVSKFI